MGGMRSLRELGDIDAADHLISQAVRLFPADQAIAFAWAEIPRLRDDVSARLERWAEVRTQHPHSPGGFTAGAFALFDAGQVSEAETVAREGCALFPHDRDVQRALGIILIKANKAEAADEPLERALALDPSDATALYYYAQAAFRRGSMETAIQRAEDAEARFPDDIRIKDLIRSARLPEPAATDSELSQKEEAAAVPPPPWEAPGFHYEAHQEAVQPDLVFQKPPQPNKRPSLLSRLFGQGRR
jgi:predicted Zn-dependent protease